VTIRYTTDVDGAGRILRNARRAAGLTQAELALRAGVTQSVISAYESGRREPALSTLSRLVEATGAALQLRVQHREPGIRRFPATTRGQAIEQSRQRVREVAAKHGAGNLRLFGSTARGEDRPDSDIDLLVHLEKGVGLIGLARLQRELEKILGAPVDLVPDDGLKPEVRAAVERDAVAL
jgi:predicted nucleotidyltransferase/DNA-binding XRE family transcriptional regulator